MEAISLICLLLDFIFNVIFQIITKDSKRASFLFLSSSRCPLHHLPRALVVLIAGLQGWVWLPCPTPICTSASPRAPSDLWVMGVSCPVL